MNLFYPQIDQNKYNKNFASTLLTVRSAERKTLLDWAKGFPDRDGKFVKEFQTTFNSCFWEIYLHAVFKEYGFELDWKFTSPDFLIVGSDFSNVAVEATTANSADGKLNEWDKFFSPEELKGISFNELNRESIIRLSNAIIGKTRRYNEHYKSLKHVRDVPFVLAIAPFEQPHFNLQYDRPIKALLYDYYVDEDVYLNDPCAFPDGPPVRHLGFVSKDNGAEIPLGIFNDDQYSEISAIIFSTTATWGKVDALTKNSKIKGDIQSTWATPPNGVPESRFVSRKDHIENITDGLQIYHNPYARRPIAPQLFRRSGVVQAFPNLTDGAIEVEEGLNCLQVRQVFLRLSTKDKDELLNRVDPLAK